MRNHASLFLFFLLIFFHFAANSQVGINTDLPNSRAVLDLHSPTNDQGLLVPRISTVQRMANAFTSSLTAAENGLLIFDTDENLFYYWLHPSWKAVETGAEANTWHSGVELPANSLGQEGDFYLNVADGNIYKKTAGAYMLTLNIKGETGPQGLKGDQGDAGLMGPEGPAGPQGIEGLQGPQGLKGDQGDAGPMGPEGPAGPQGIEGLQGPQGLKGDQGDVGPMGPEGPAGPQGIEGLQGPQGLKGDQGDMGLMGPEGPAGPQGIEGLQGPQGLKGDQGDAGPMGPEGPAGPQGIEGLQGPQGLKGDQGDVGPMGPQGPAGPQGPEGPQGPQGEPGIPTAFSAISISSNYTATASDDVIIALNGGTTITLPSASSVPGKVYHIRHNLGLLDLIGSVTIRAPSGNAIVDGSASQTLTIGLLASTAVSIIAVDPDRWYVIGKF